MNESSTPLRKRRKLLDDDEDEEAIQAALEVMRSGSARAHRVSVTPQPSRHAVRSLSALAPPSPTVTPARRYGSPLPARSMAGIRSERDDSTTPKRPISQPAASTSLLRSALRHGPAAFAPTHKKSEGAMHTGSEHDSSSRVLHRLTADPFLKTPSKPVEHRPLSNGLSRRTTTPTASSTHNRDDEATAEAQPLTTVPPFALTLPRMKQQDVGGPVRPLSDIAPAVDADIKPAVEDVELSSPRKRKGGGGLLANGLARAATETLQRARTDQSLWQHNLARRLGQVLEASSGGEPCTIATLCEAIEPDIRLRIVTVLRGLPSSGPRLIAQCALLSDVDKTEESQASNGDSGTVIFSLATMQVPAGSGKVKAVPPTPHILLPSRHRPARSPHAASAIHPPTLTLVTTPADLVTLLRPGAEVWVFDPWSAVSIAADLLPTSRERADGIVETQGTDDEDSRRALICTRFAVLRS